jgi:hypothetical protein
MAVTSENYCKGKIIRKQEKGRDEDLFGELTAASSENYYKEKNKRYRKKAEMVIVGTGGI